MTPAMLLQLSPYLGDRIVGFAGLFLIFCLWAYIKLTDANRKVNEGVRLADDLAAESARHRHPSHPHRWQ